MNVRTVGNPLRKGSTLSKHHWIHNGEKPFECNESWKTFSSRSVLSQQKGYTVEEIPLSAVTVGKPLKPRAALPCTKKFLQLGRRHECSDWQSQFRHYLTVHQRIHTGEKLCECAEVGEDLQSRSPDFAKCKRIHIGERENTTSVLSVGRLSVARSDIKYNLLWGEAIWL